MLDVEMKKSFVSVFHFYFCRAETSDRVIVRLKVVLKRTVVGDDLLTLLGSNHLPYQVHVNDGSDLFLLFQ